MFNKRIWFWILITGLPWLLIPQPSGAVGLEAAIGIFYQDSQGGLSNNGETLDLRQDLKYSGSPQIFGRIKIDMPLVIPNLYLLATPIRFDGTGNKNVSFKFGDQTFSAGSPFSSKLSLDHYDLAFYYGLPFIKQATLGTINIDAGLNIRVIDLKTELTQGAHFEARSFSLFMPMIYLGLQVKPVDFLSLEGEFRGFAYNSIHYYDLIGRVKYKIINIAFVSAGYRSENISTENSGVKLDAQFSGPFLEVGFQF